jgi:SNW domain-containing protein 1
MSSLYLTHTVSGRGLQEHVVNDKFSSFSEALFIAERNAREEVEKRNQIAVRLAMKDQVRQILLFSL